MFSTYESAIETELSGLKTSNAGYNDFLTSPRGESFADALGSPGLLKLLGSARAVGGGSAGSGDGAQGASSATGLGCKPSTEPATLQGKLDALNCLVFATPHSFWVGITGDDREALDDGGWLGTGNWECDVVPEGPLPSCRKHDVGFHSLQKFYGADSTEVLDRTWNPRNKALADAKFWADIVRYGCLGADGLEAWVCLGSNRLTAGIYFWGVAKHNNKGWPVTTQDLDHARAHRSIWNPDDGTTGSVSTHAFVDCENKMPSVDGIAVTRVNDDDDFRVGWTHRDGCVAGIGFARIAVALSLQFDNGEIGYGEQSFFNGTATSATFEMDQYDDLKPVLSVVEVNLYPDAWEYGGASYSHEKWTDWVNSPF